MRRTCAEAQVNLAIKWFLGYGLEEKTPHFSDFSKTYTRKFSKEIEEECERLGFNKPKEISLGKKEVKKVK